VDKIIKFESQKEAQGIFGAHDSNTKSIEKELKVKLTLRGDYLKISGTASNIKKASQLVEYLLSGLRRGNDEIGKNDLS